MSIIFKSFNYLKKLIIVDNSIKNITISVINRYIFFLTGLLITTTIPSTLRGVYLWGGTINACVICYLNKQLTFHLFLIAIGGLLHSSCHLYWPFLVETINGFDESVSAFPDVFFHTTMLIFIWTSIRKTLSNSVNNITIFFITGSIINCMFTNYNSSNNSFFCKFKEPIDESNALVKNDYKNQFQYLLFNITSVFQAISTAYWIASVIHYKQWHLIEYKDGLSRCVYIIVVNWFFYELDHFLNLELGLIYISMKYRYIEGLFIVSTWIPLLFIE